jgi:hypothetical protein
MKHQNPYAKDLADRRYHQRIVAMTKRQQIEEDRYHEALDEMELTNDQEL